MSRFVLGFMMALTAVSGFCQDGSPDRVLLPPERREFTSPNGGFILVLTTADHWQTPHSCWAELFRSEPGGRQSVWKRGLPHYHGPRSALVSDGGEVLLADEWINALSEFAILVIDPSNRTVASYPSRQVFAALDVPLREISSHAKAGVWITKGPTLSRDGRSALFSAGGRTLDVSLVDGRLTLHK